MWDACALQLETHTRETFHFSAIGDKRNQPCRFASQLFALPAIAGAVIGPVLRPANCMQ
jgi:hypothetical protein